MKYIHILLIVIVSNIFIGCNFKLEEELFSAKSYSNYFKSLDDFKASLIGVTRDMKNFKYFSQGFILNDLGLSDVGGGNMTSGNWYNIVYGNMDASHPTIHWDPAYQAIASCNVILSHLDNNSLSQEQLNWVKGQALFLRAYNYFNLVQSFGPLPLHLKEIVTEEDASLPRTSELDVYSQIVNDLKEAQVLLPDEYMKNYISGKQFAIDMTAAALLSKVYLTMAGNPLKLGDSYYEKSRDKAYEVIASKKYSLLNDFAYLFDLNHENSSEAILELDFINSDTYGTGLPCFLAPTGSKGAVKTFGTIRVRKKFVQDWRNSTCENGFEEEILPNGSIKISEKDGVEDYRYSVTLIREFVDIKGNRNILFPKKRWQDTNKELSQYSFISKYYDESGVSQGGHGNNVILMRFAEIYLIFAEAQNELVGPIQRHNDLSALEAINIVRERARNANGEYRAYPKNLSSSISNDDFRRKVFEERGWELVGEGSRYFDLKRAGLLKEMLEADKGGKYGNYLDPPKVYNQKCYYFPLPQKEVQQNKFISENNPGY